LEFPYEKIPSLNFTMTLAWTQNQVQQYLRSWIGVNKYIETHERDPVPAPADKLKITWENELTKTKSWPLVLVLCRKS